MTTSSRYKKNQFIIFSGLFLLSLAFAAWFELYFLIGIPFALLFFYAGWQSVNAVFFLLLFSLPFSTELQVTPSLGTDFPDELLMLSTAGIFFCYLLYSPTILSKRVKRHPLVFGLLITVVWSVVATLFSTDHLISTKFLLAKCWYLGAFVLAPLIVFREKRTIKIAVLALAISLLVVVIITLLRHYEAGLSFATINEVLHPFFRNHVNYSAMLVCVIPIFFGIYRLVRPGSRYLLVISIIVLLAALFLSFSRGAWLALIVGLFSWTLIRRKLLMTAYIAIIALMLGFVFWIKSNDRYLEYAHNYRRTIFHEDFREHLAATYQFRDMSTAERFYRWIAGVRMIKDNALTGYGPNTFYYNYKPYAVPAFKTWVSDNKEHSTVHNYFLLITIEQGIPGLIFFLLLAGAMLYYAQRLYHRVNDRFYKTIAITTGTILMMIMTVNFLSDLIETDKVGSLFFLCLSMLIITDVNTRRDSNSSPDIEGIS